MGVATHQATATMAQGHLRADTILPGHECHNPEYVRQLYESYLDSIAAAQVACEGQDARQRRGLRRRLRQQRRDDDDADDEDLKSTNVCRSAAAADKAARKEARAARRERKAARKEAAASASLDGNKEREKDWEAGFFGAREEEGWLEMMFSSALVE